MRVSRVEHSLDQFMLLLWAEWKCDEKMCKESLCMCMFVREWRLLIKCAAWLMLWENRTYIWKFERRVSVKWVTIDWKKVETAHLNWNQTHTNDHLRFRWYIRWSACRFTSRVEYSRNSIGLGEKSSVDHWKTESNLVRSKKNKETRDQEEEKHGWQVNKMNGKVILLMTSVTKRKRRRRQKNTRQ